MAFGKEMKMMGGKSRLGAKDSGASGAQEKAPARAEDEAKPEDGGGDLSLHANGDGSYKTSDGEEHEHLGKALMHMAHHAEPDGKHMHIHHDGLSAKSHSVDDQGQHESQDGDAESAKSHMDSLFGDQPDQTPGEQKPPVHHAEPMMGGYGG